MKMDAVKQWNANRSMPWLPQEMAIVGGHPLTYTYEGQAVDGGPKLLVKMPGGVTMTPEQIKARGISFEFPRVVRRERQPALKNLRGK